MKTSIATLLALSLTLAAGTAAANGISLSNRSPDATTDAQSYWTSERLAKAKPLTLAVIKGKRDVGSNAFGTSDLDYSRSQIPQPGGNTMVPYRPSGILFFTIPGVGDAQCSASVVDNRLVLTAAHCLYANGAFYTNWLFIPGFDGTKPAGSTAQRPYGSWSWANVIVPNNWGSTNGALPNATDFGLIETSDNVIKSKNRTIASQTGKYGTVINRLFDNQVTMLGYPGNFDGGNIMQRCDGGDHRVGPNHPAVITYEYGCDMSSGASGGPWLQNFGSGAAPTGGFAERNAVVGVTSYIYGGTDLNVLGASELNDEYVAMRAAICGFRAGNC